jgi:hypothetical protein
MGKNIKDIVSYDKNGFIINGKREFLIGGEFHYFRVPAALWEDRLQKMKATGANLISVYIAWNMHEPEEGKERWTGDYDLDRFLTLCEKYGFYVLIKPGPYICAELDFGGHPDWLIAKIANKEFRLRMLDEGYLKLCKKWYKTCAEKINKHLITNGGNIIAAQIENEYDHLIEYGEETITVDDAIEYFMFLKAAMEEYGIDVPKFANEAEFLRGRGIIDTRTYYPNIPGLWMSEFERFEEKLISSKKSQSDSPIMILELQAGWFSQIGAPTYEPGLEVVEGVSKSVFITGASIVNYYMMVGGTTFPFIGARGDTVFSGGLGNITSYDFGGSPVRENGEIHKDKFYWIKGFIRFAKEFSHIIAESDGKSFAKIISGGENIAVLGESDTILDYSLDKSYENFTTYEEGNADGRFFFVRNVEDDVKNMTISVSKDLTGYEYSFKATVQAKESRMFPLSFKIPGTDLAIDYATSEVLLSNKYEKGSVFAMYGKTGTCGEMLIKTGVEDIAVVRGQIDIHKGAAGSLLQYKHDDIIIVKVKDTYIFIIEEVMIGRVDELAKGLMFHNTYYLQAINDNGNNIVLDIQVKEDSKDFVKFFPLTSDADLNVAKLDGQKVSLQKDESGMYTASFEIASLLDKPEVVWTSDWKYCGDAKEVSSQYDYSDWRVLESPISLEEAGLIEHGYYWYKSDFELSSDPGIVFMSYKHNDTDRMFIYLNEELIYKSNNKPIDHKDISKFLKAGKNTLTILYANEFHNKSHPHEGDIVKFSGIMNPFEIFGTYKDNSDLKIDLTSFSVKKGLTGMAEGYTTLQFDDSKWAVAPNVEKFVTGKELGHIVWFRRNFKYNVGEGFTAPLKFIPIKADQRLTLYVNGKPVARYDALGPQEEFYVPDSYINQDGDNVLSVILECPGFYEEIMSGYRRGFMYNPKLEHGYVSKKVNLEIK